MADVDHSIATTTRPKVERPKLHRVILLNDDFTPRELVVLILEEVFRLSEDQATPVMLAAHQKGAAVIAAYTREIAETKAAQAMAIAEEHGCPLAFTTEPAE